MNKQPNWNKIMRERISRTADILERNQRMKEKYQPKKHVLSKEEFRKRLVRDLCIDS